jgi:4-aminobutyrate aminotransferase-like enzyme
MLPTTPGARRTDAGQLAERLSGFGYVGDVRGRGLLPGVEFVEDRASRAPLVGGSALVTGLRAVSELVESRGLAGNRIDLRVFSGH